MERAVATEKLIDPQGYNEGRDEQYSSSAQVRLGEENQQQFSDDLHRVPHITIAEDYPTKEARAFGTRIDR